MIELSGLTVKNFSQTKGDIEIKITGLRPEKKLFEELFYLKIQLKQNILKSLDLRNLYSSRKINQKF